MATTTTAAIVAPTSKWQIDWSFSLLLLLWNEWLCVCVCVCDGIDKFTDQRKYQINWTYFPFENSLQNKLYGKKKSCERFAGIDRDWAQYLSISLAEECHPFYWSEFFSANFFFIHFFRSSFRRTLCAPECVYLCKRMCVFVYFIVVVVVVAIMCHAHSVKLPSQSSA